MKTKVAAAVAIVFIALAAGKAQAAATSATMTSKSVAGTILSASGALCLDTGTTFVGVQFYAIDPNGGTINGFISLVNGNPVPGGWMGTANANPTDVYL